MTLILDRRAELDGPGLHALVAGVSRYPHLPGGDGAPAAQALGMQQLTSCALSAFRIASWLRSRADRLTAPLATLRLLLSPSADEERVEPALRGVADACTFDALRKSIAAWRTSAQENLHDATVFYFAGHGVQRSKGDAVLLCEDFGNGIGGILDNAFSSVNL